ncbi:hypothetical protein M2352_001912 [Azospirillum fermentarium]|uniref:SPOR domain-containing protein n=1 Tax=Azospirillum fermentarium TaxID=1233114 RepID=UPI0022271F3C|nr:SPOR domain-containing protein [Azospirillum fermentarium]MCW2246321.1 hypothetical protein [Azospirillum fermentarium]
MQYDDTQYGADPYGYPPARSGRRGLLALGAAVVGVAAFAGVIVFAYSRGQHAVHNGAPPLLEADATPTKSRPQDPGGYEVPHQDKMVYERLNAAPAKPGLERLLPPPEQPLPRPVVSPQVPPLQPAPVVAVADVPAPQPPAPAPQAAAPVPAPQAQPTVVASAPPASSLAPAPPAAGQSSQLAALPAAPAKPKPVAPKPAPAAIPAAPSADAPAAGARNAGNGKNASNATGAAAHTQPPVNAAALPPTVQAKQTPPAPAKAVPATLTPPPASAAPAKTVPAALTPPPATASAPAAGTLVPPSARPGGNAGRGGWRVQLASVPSESQAQGEWKRLSNRHADVLGGLGVNFAQATINGATYYRVQAGVVDETRARSICAALKAQSVGCILVAP